MTPEKLEQLRRMKGAIGNGHPQDALDFINGPKYGRDKLEDLFETEGCMHTSPVFKQVFNVCLNCTRLDRLNMSCAVGRKPHV